MSKATVSSIPWARAHLVRGDKPRHVAFASGVPARVTVGSDPRAGLCVRAPDVAPLQLELVWDGTNVWLQDGLRLGCTFVNGRLLNDWVAVMGQVIVSFAAIRLWIVAGGPQPASHAPDFAALERASLAEPHSEIRRRDTGRITLTPELKKA